MTASSSRGVGVDATAAKVRIRGLRKDFSVRGKRVIALAGIDLEIRSGEFVCIVGPSGCGKSTMLRILADLEMQSAGDVDIRRERDDRSLPLASMVFQEQSVLPWKTVRDNVGFGLRCRGLPRSAQRRIVDEYIRKVGLVGFADALPYQLSGGMKQRVSIARAFANNPEVLLMDEPFAALDEQTKLVLQEELLCIWEESGTTVVYVTHSIDEAIVLADRIVVMSARPGRIKMVVDVRDVFGRPRSVEQVRSSPRFGELFGLIWNGLRDEVSPESAVYAPQAAGKDAP